MADNEYGVISKESAMKISLVAVMLAACIGASMWAGKFMTLAERTSSDVSEIKTSIKDMSVSIQKVNDMATRNMVKIESLETRPKGK